MAVNKIQPEFLKQGDEVAIISPSFCIDEEILFKAVAFLESWGLRVRVGKNASKSSGPFAGSDEDRLSDLQEMTNDHSVKAIFCSRGGYGVSRIISRVDFRALHENPKWYIGFSDITVLHLWLSEVCGVISVHGDMPLNFYNPEKTVETFESLQQILFGTFQQCEWSGSFYRTADVKGEIAGGNLSLIYSLIGTPGDPDTKGKILFIEDVGEYFYHIDRILTSLKLAGKLHNLAALVIGGMNNMVDGKIPWGRSIEDTIYGIVSEYNYPVFFNFPAGHVSDNRAFYLGKQAEIKANGKNAVLTFV